ncbi:200 kDa antigen p200 [Tanacetum coccineum]
MKKSKNTESDLGDTSMPEKQPEENMEDVRDALYFLFYMNNNILLFEKNIDGDIYKDLATVEALNVVTSNNFCNLSTEIDKSKGKKVEDDDEDFVVEEQHDEEDDNKNFELKFKSLRSMNTVSPYTCNRIFIARKEKQDKRDGLCIYVGFPISKDTRQATIFCTQELEYRKNGSFIANWIQNQNYTKKNLGSVGYPNGEKKLESDSPRDFNDEFLTAFKKQFEGKKYPTTTDLSKLIQRTTNIDFMFQINYLMLFANCMINCDNTSRLKYYVIKNIKSSDIISDFDWCSFIWDHIKTSKIGWDDRTLQNWYYGVQIHLIYLHYTKCDGMVTIPRKWPAIRNWTSKDATDREMFEMSQGKFGLVDVIEEIEETENESEVEKRKLKELIYETIEAKFESVLKEKRELEDMLKENMEMHELFYEDEKFELFVKKFKEEFTTGLNRDENQAGTSGARHGNGNDDVGYAGHCNDEDDVGHANDEDDDEAAEEKEANEATKKKEEAEKLAAANKKEAAEKSAKQAAEKNAKEAKEKAEKEAAEKAEREEIEAAKKNKQAAEKEKKEKAEKEAAEKKKAEMRKAAAEKKEQAEIQAAAEAKLKDKMQKDAEEKKQSPSKKKKNNKSEPTAEKGVDVSEATTIIDTFVTVLNYEEKSRTDGKDLRRRYFPTDAVLLNEDKDQAKQYESFENVIKNQMNASESKKKMKDVELAFFPKVVAAGQYYVIVFNLLKANAVILDNEKHDDYNKYKEVFDSVKVLFLEYLQKHQHPCVEKLSKDKPAKVLKMKWKTEKNKIDSGLYMMMHMELYQGESATNWKTDIVQENNRDYEIQMTSMRMRYLTKILIHEINTKRGFMSGYGKKLSEDNKDEEKVKKMVENGINRKIAEKNKI